MFHASVACCPETPLCANEYVPAGMRACDMVRYATLPYNTHNIQYLQYVQYWTYLTYTLYTTILTAIPATLTLHDMAQHTKPPTLVTLPCPYRTIFHTIPWCHHACLLRHGFGPCANSRFAGRRYHFPFKAQNLRTQNP